MDAKPNRVRAFTRILCINLLIALSILEGALQIVNAIGHGNTSPIVKKIYWYIKPHASMEELFLSSYADKGSMIYAGIHNYHPTRGWAMKPSAHFQAKPKVSYTTNAQGYRALYNYENKPETYQVMVLGDSFTFGDEINDDETWTYLLQQKSPQLNVLNMAGSGYGTDQMLLTLEEEIAQYHPKLVIAAFIDDNLFRSTLSFRDYKKPLFVLNNNTLKLTNTPIGDPHSVMKEIAQRRYFSYSHIQILNLIGFFVNNLTRLEGSPDCNQACQKINVAIFDRMSAIALENDAEFMLVYLPRGEEIKSATFSSYGETFFDAYKQDRKEYFINPKNQFIAANFIKAPEHYHKNETTLLSDFLFTEIKKTDSWQCATLQNCSH